MGRAHDRKLKQDRMERRIEISADAKKHPVHVFRTKAARTIYLEPWNPETREGRIAPPEIVPGDPAVTWAIIVTAPRSERRVYADLTDDRFMIYLPVMTRWVQHAREKRQVERPLLPGYLFLGMRGDGPAWPLEKPDGVSDVIWLDTTVSLTLSKVLAELRRRQVDLNEWDETAPTGIAAEAARRSPFKQGDQVRVKEGAFSTFCGMVERADAETARVLIDIFGRMTPVEDAVENFELT